MKKILFYLPNVTPWWFDNIVAPLIHLLADAHEVHVMVPPLWRSTGIEGRQLRAFLATSVTWHILDGDDHPALRDGIAGHDDLVAFVHDLAPDHVLCRCADPEVMRRFPGTVRYIMEGVAPPLRMHTETVILTDQPFAYGALPAMEDADAGRLDRAFAGIWSAFERDMSRRTMPDWRAQAGIAPDRKVIALPLEYEFEDTFTGPHRAFGDNAAMVAEIAGRIDDDIFLAVTNHPLNDLYVDNGAVEAAVAALDGRAAIIRLDEFDANATEAVARDCDGAILDLSKSYLVYARFGVPFARPTNQPTAGWLHAERDVDAFVTQVRQRTARAADPDALRRWFAHHIANNSLHLLAGDLTAEDVTGLIERPFDPDRWDRNIARFERLMGIGVHA